MWYVTFQSMIKSDPEGPFEATQIIEMAEVGQIKSDTLLMHKETTKGQWVSASRLPKINGAIEQYKTNAKRKKQAAKERKQELDFQKKEAKQQLALEKQKHKLAAQATQLEPHVAKTPTTQPPMHPQTTNHAIPQPPPVSNMLPAEQTPQQQPVVQVNNVVQPQQTMVVNYGHHKSAAVAFLLTFFFGPLGMFYSTVAGGLICSLLGFIVIPIIAVVTLGLGLLLYIPYWILCLVWAIVAC